MKWDPGTLSEQWFKLPLECKVAMFHHEKLNNIFSPHFNIVCDISAEGDSADSKVISVFFKKVS